MSFPEQGFAPFWGRKLTGDGLDIFHEMLQNQADLHQKKKPYMLFVYHFGWKYSLRRRRDVSNGAAPQT
jgi:hypothetical protein